MIRQITRNVLMERVWSRIERRSPFECWPASGSHTGGYRTINVGGKTPYLHRLVLEEKLGRPIRDGYCSLHSCDNNWCANPRHLREGTQLENIEDRNRRKRTAKGEAVGSAKITTADVKQIRKRRATGEFGRLIAADFNISTSHVYQIANGKEWKHLGTENTPKLVSIVDRLRSRRQLEQKAAA